MAEQIKHDVFISYSTKNKNVADAIVADFEQHGIKCWYAPRDILPGQEWVSAIKDALEGSKMLILVYTGEANDSRQVMNEVALAFNAGKTIVPFRLTEEQMNNELEYYLTRVHWLDAVSKPLSNNIEELRKYVGVILQKPEEVSGEKRSVDQENPASAGNKKKKVVPIAIGAAAVVLAAVVGLVLFLGGGTGKLMQSGLEAYHSKYHGSSDNELAREYFEKAAKKGNADAYYYLGSLDERIYDYAAALSHYQEGVEKGSDLARLGLGNLYRNGNGVLTNLEKANDLFDEALDNGCVEANYYKGIMIKNGLVGEDADANKALELLDRVADSENPSFVAAAAEAKGTICKNGYAGVEKDIDKALKYYNEAIEAYPFAEGYGNADIASMYASEGETVREEEYYKKALAFYETAAEEGNISAINTVGLYYRKGRGTEADGEKAMDYYRKAADAGNYTAMDNIGIMYENGYANVKKDMDKAYEWYKKAADAGYADAMKDLGDLYYDGKYGAKDDEPDYNTARQWYEKAAENGYSGAYTSLGNMYKNGKGVEKDDEKALDNYMKGVARGNSGAMNQVGICYHDGIGVEKDYVQAMEWYLKASNAGSSSAMYNLGKMYMNGEGIDQPDYEEAKNWYMCAAEEDDAAAMNKLGNLYFYAHLSAEPDYENARKWYQKAANEGNKDAFYSLGKMYYYAYGVEQDYVKARENYEKAGESDANALNMLGVIYDEGRGVPVDYVKAKEYYEKAEKQGSDQALDNLGSLYYDGHGVEQSYAKARTYYEQAVEKGSSYGDTLKNLGMIYYKGYDVTADYTKAKNYFLKAEEAGVDDAEMWGALGSIFYEEKDHATSAKYFVKQAEKNQSAVSMRNAGVEFSNAGDYENALIWYGKAIDNGYEKSDDLKTTIKKMVSDGKVSAEAAAKWLK